MDMDNLPFSRVIYEVYHSFPAGAIKSGGFPGQLQNMTCIPSAIIYYFGNEIIAEIIKFNLIPFRSPLAGQPRNMAFFTLAMDGSCKSRNYLIAKVIIAEGIIAKVITAEGIATKHL